MGERLTDDELAALEHQRLWSEDEQRLLLTEVLDRREAEKEVHALILAGALRERAEHLDRIATLEAALRECIDDENGLHVLVIRAASRQPGDFEKFLPLANDMVDRARAALKGGGA